MPVREPAWSSGWAYRTPAIARLPGFTDDQIITRETRRGGTKPAAMATSVHAFVVPPREPARCRARSTASAVARPTNDARSHEQCNPGRAVGSLFTIRGDNRGESLLLGLTYGVARPLLPQEGMSANRRGPHWIDMKSICQPLLERHAPQAEEQRVTIDLSLCPEPAIVIGYEDRLQQSIDVLMRHALRAMPHGGRLTVRVERDQHVTVECADSGRHESAADELTDVAATITGHGGLIWRNEPPGGGTSFTVELRAAGPARPTAA